MFSYDVLSYLPTRERIHESEYIPARVRRVIKTQYRGLADGDNPLRFSAMIDEREINVMCSS